MFVKASAKRLYAIREQLLFIQFQILLRVIQWIFLQINDNLILSNLVNSWYRQCAWRKPDWKLDDYKNKPITNAQYCVTPSNSPTLSCKYWDEIRYCDTDLCNEFAKGSKITSPEHMIVSSILMVYLYSCYP